MVSYSHTPDDIIVDLEVAPNTFTSFYGGEYIPAYVRGNDAIRITRGLVDRQSAVAPTQATVTFNDPNGFFNGDNPLSALYGIIGQNTRMRTGVQRNGTWDEFARLPDVNGLSNGARVYTADKASIRLTGDLDIRWEMTPAYVRDMRMSIGGRWVITGNQRSWFLETRSDGQLALAHTADGSTILTNVSGWALPETTGRIAMRVTLDVNDGAGNRIYRWYTSDSIDGTWTQVSTGTVAGVTTIFAGTAACEIGSVNIASGPFTGSRCFAGKIFAFQMFNGIAGTQVLDFRPAGHGPDDSTPASWADAVAAPNTYVFESNTNTVRLGSDRIRMSGEISSLPRLSDGTGNDVYSTYTVSGLLRRLANRNSSIGSPIYRLYRNYPNLRGYWPLEDASGSASASSAISGGQAGSLTQATFGSATGLAGSAGALTLSSAPNVSKAAFSGAGLATGYSSFLFYFRLDTLPAAGDQAFVTLESPTSSTGVRWVISISNIGFNFKALSPTGVTLDTGSSTFGSLANPLDQWIGMQLILSQSGGNIHWETWWHAVGTTTFYTHFLGGDDFAGTLNVGMTQATFNTTDVAFAGAQIAHVLLSGESSLNLVTAKFRDASKGYTGERVGRRLQRLAVEESVFFEWQGDLDATEQVGPQPIANLFTIFSDGASVDGGILTEPRDMLGLLYITRVYLGNRRGITFDYSASELKDTPQPIGDDRYIVNDYTVTSPLGGSARYEANDGRRKSVTDPPVGAGRYERSGSVNVASASQLYGQAAFQVFLGTWDEPRVPNVSQFLHRTEISSSLIKVSDMIALDQGSALSLIGLTAAPRGLVSTDNLNMLLLGYTEVIDNFTWAWVGNTVPGGPYWTPILDSGSASVTRLDAASGSLATTVNADVTSSAVSIVFKTPNTVPSWITTATWPAEFPVNIQIAGEVMTLTAMSGVTPSGSNNLQTATVTRAVNGISKAQVATSEIYLAEPFYLGLG